MNKVLRQHTPLQLPEGNQLRDLALSDSGFIFDPHSGLSFSANETAIFLIKALQHGNDPDAIVSQVTAQYDVDPQQAKQALGQVCDQLRGCLL